MRVVPEAAAGIDRPRSSARATRAAVLALVCFVLFVLLAVAVQMGWSQALDLRLMLTLAPALAGLVHPRHAHRELYGVGRRRDSACPPVQPPARDDPAASGSRRVTPCYAEWLGALMVCSSSSSSAPAPMSCLAS